MSYGTFPVQSGMDVGTYLQCFEDSLSSYEGDDPLEPWDKFVEFLEQRLPAGGGMSVVFDSLVQRFLNVERYANDIRYVNHCIKCASYYSDPVVLYSHVFSKGVGTRTAALYLAWAQQFEGKGMNEQADAVYQKALENQAQPGDAVLHEYRAFQARTRSLPESGGRNPLQNSQLTNQMPPQREAVDQSKVSGECPSKPPVQKMTIIVSRSETSGGPAPGGPAGVQVSEYLREELLLQGSELCFEEVRARKYFRLLQERKEREKREMTERRLREQEEGVQRMKRQLEEINQRLEQPVGALPGRGGPRPSVGLQAPPPSQEAPPPFLQAPPSAQEAPPPDGPSDSSQGGELHDGSRFPEPEERLEVSQGFSNPSHFTPNSSLGFVSATPSRPLPSPTVNTREALGVIMDMFQAPTLLEELEEPDAADRSEADISQPKPPGSAPFSIFQDDLDSQRSAAPPGVLRPVTAPAIGGARPEKNNDSPLDLVPDESTMWGARYNSLNSLAACPNSTSDFALLAQCVSTPSAHKTPSASSFFQDQENVCDGADGSGAFSRRQTKKLSPIIEQSPSEDKASGAGGGQLGTIVGEGLAPPQHGLTSSISSSISSSSTMVQPPPPAQLSFRDQTLCPPHPGPAKEPFQVLEDPGPAPMEPFRVLEDPGPAPMEPFQVLEDPGPAPMEPFRVLEDPGPAPMEPFQVLEDPGPAPMEPFQVLEDPGPAPMEPFQVLEDPGPAPMDPDWVQVQVRSPKGPMEPFQVLEDPMRSPPVPLRPEWVPMRSPKAPLRPDWVQVQVQSPEAPIEPDLDAFLSPRRAEGQDPPMSPEQLQPCADEPMMSPERGLGRGLDMKVERGMERGLDMKLQRSLVIGMDRGLERDLERSLNMKLEKGMENGLERSLDMGIEKTLDMKLERGMERGLERSLNMRGDRGMERDLDVSPEQLQPCADEPMMSPERGLERGLDMRGDRKLRGLERSLERSLNMKVERGMDMEMERGLERSLNMKVERGLDMEMERGLERSLNMKVERGMDMGMERGLERSLNMKVERGLDMEMERSLVIGMDRGLERDLDMRGDRGLDMDMDKGEDIGMDRAQPTPPRLVPAPPRLVSDPWDSELISGLLGSLRPPLSAHPRCVSWPCNLPAITPKTTISMGRFSLRVDGVLGEGAFATVYQATDPRTSEKVVLKVQRPANPWEFYVHTQLENRLRPAERRLFGAFSSAHLFRDASVLLGELHGFGTLLNVVNVHRRAGDRLLPPPLVLYLAACILNSVERLHNAQILHADIKPDNFLLGERFLESRSFDPESCDHGLVLIDLGQSIDMRLFPEGTAFTARCQTSGFQCTEMLSGKPWSYQTDYFGIAGTVHCLLFGSYMTVTQEGGIWRSNGVFRRNPHSELWLDFFHSLLNSSDSAPPLDPAPPLGPAPPLSGERPGLLPRLRGRISAVLQSEYSNKLPSLKSRLVVQLLEGLKGRR